MEKSSYFFHFPFSRKDPTPRRASDRSVSLLIESWIKIIHGLTETLRKAYGLSGSAHRFRYISYHNICPLGKGDVSQAHTIVRIFLRKIFYLVGGPQYIIIGRFLMIAPLLLLLYAGEKKLQAHVGVRYFKKQDGSRRLGIEADGTARIKIAASVIVCVIYGAKKQGG